MQKILWLVLVLALLLISACSPNSSMPTVTEAPTLDMSNVQSILPTVDPEQVMAGAQLADAETIAAGRERYLVYCAECHGANGEGQFPENPMQPDETGRIGAPPHDSSGHTWHHPDSLLYDYVRDGGSSNAMFYPMPAFGAVLTDADIETIFAYIKSLWTDEQRMIQAENSLRPD